MKKEEFLTKLRSRLNGLPKSDIDERISFYSEMIDDRVSEGKTEDEAVADLGGVEAVVREIANDTPLVNLVTERIKPKRTLKGWEVALIVLGFPLWFPLIITFISLLFVFYVLIWVGVIVVFSLFVSMIGCALAGIISMFSGQLGGIAGGFGIGAGTALFGLGGAIVLYFLLSLTTNLTIKLSRKIIVGIKSWFIGKGENK